MNVYFKLTGFLILFLIRFQLIALSNIDSLSIKSLHSANSSHKLSLLWFNSGYRMPVNRQKILNSGHGFYAELGINPGILIKKDLLFAVYGGWAFMDRSWKTSFNNNFYKAYSNAIIEPENQTSFDSTLINSSTLLFETKKGNSLTVPGCEMNSFHNYTLYFGIAIKLPYKNYPILKLYKGSLRSHYQGYGGIVSKNKDFNIFEIRRALYGCELMVLTTNQVLNRVKNIKQTLKRGCGALSIYYEMSDFYHSSLYFYDGITRKTISFAHFVKQDFLTKYKREVFFGFKISYNFF